MNLNAIFRTTQRIDRSIAGYALDALAFAKRDGVSSADRLAQGDGYLKSVAEVAPRATRKLIEQTRADAGRPGITSDVAELMQVTTLKVAAGLLPPAVARALPVEAMCAEPDMVVDCAVAYIRQDREEQASEARVADLSTRAAKAWTTHKLYAEIGNHEASQTMRERHEKLAEELKDAKKAATEVLSRHKQAVSPQLQAVRDEIHDWRVSAGLEIGHDSGGGFLEGVGELVWMLLP